MFGQHTYVVLFAYPSKRARFQSLETGEAVSRARSKVQEKKKKREYKSLRFLPRRPFLHGLELLRIQFRLPLC